ncbi:hypothetical protein N0V95_002741 [Ascochyta clinopodiicola]|nr:hypothetical protein N0V95_002741 [Ascochyta clinopodiicola]
MKAAQYFGQRDIRVVDVPVAEPQAHEALIAIEWCGICGSDLHEYLHGPLICPTPSLPHPTTREHIPVTMGHEFTGRVLSAPASSGLAPGTPVIVDPRIFCRSCSRCMDGHTHGCTTLGFKGLSGTGGGFSERICVDAKLCHVLPEGTDLSLATLIEPLAVAWHAVATTGLEDWPNRRSPMQIPFFPFMLKEITIKCCLAYNEQEFKDVVEAFVAGRFQGIESMVTSKIHIDDTVEKGFEELVTNKDQHVKILVTPDQAKILE